MIPNLIIVGRTPIPLLCRTERAIAEKLLSPELEAHVTSITHESINEANPDKERVPETHRLSFAIIMDPTNYPKPWEIDEATGVSMALSALLVAAGLAQDTMVDLLKNPDGSYDLPVVLGEGAEPWDLSTPQNRLGAAQALKYTVYDGLHGFSHDRLSSVPADVMIKTLLHAKEANAAYNKREVTKPPGLLHYTLLAVTEVLRGLSDVGPLPLTIHEQ